MARFVIDIDDTISKWDDSRDYVNFIPYNHMIERINDLHKAGHTIVLFTARGMVSTGGNKYRIETEIRGPLEKWLKKNKVKYHELIMGKPQADYYVDDKNLSISEFLKGEFE